ncbi:uncharacterized protein LOC133785040 [Humulus lupulus]|uniref:uncharacterized protein LOC133785040 n=1 Tax=Humulus lupulus TaxID=3486 RepID=UPI002B4153CC|nr:uncharacterized protein LOC133785040 [Humulus lupulus]
MKAWDPDVRFTKEDVWKVPVWVQLRNLELKYWGERSMEKNFSSLGKTIKPDQATQNRDKLQFARVLIEMDVSTGFSNQICFEDEKGQVIYLEVLYEWKPDKCDICKGIGHTSDMCKKVKIVEQLRKVWKPKEVSGNQNNSVTSAGIADKQEFQQAKGKKVPVASSSHVMTKNTFDVLENATINEVQVGEVLCQMRSIIDGGGDPPPIDG